MIAVYFTTSGMNEWMNEFINKLFNYLFSVFLFYTDYLDKNVVSMSKNAQRFFMFFI